MEKTFFNRPALLGSAFLVLLSFAVYYNTLGNGFVSDDIDLIVTNPWIRDADHLARIYSTHTMGYCEACPPISYRPSIFVFYIIEYAAFGLAPMGWHLVNIILHSLNSVAVFALFSLLFKDAFKDSPPGCYGVPGWLAPLAGAAFFASHPVNNESVAWISTVGELTYVLLSVSALYIHIVSRTAAAGTLKAYAYRFLPGILYFAALTFKETAVFLPVLIFIYDSIMHRDERVISIERAKRYSPYILAAAAYLAVRFLALGNITPKETFHEYLTAFQFFINFFVLFIQYIGMLAVPVNDHPMQLFRPVYSVFEYKALLSMLGLAVAASLVFSFRKRIHPLYFLAFSMMVLPILPALLSPAISKAPLADRYLYFPSIGFAGLLALFLRQALIRTGSPVARSVIISAAALVVLAYSVEAARKNLAWKSDVTLWGAAAAASADNYLALYRVGKALVKEGRADDGIKSLEESVRVNSARANPDGMILLLSHRMLATEYDKKGMVEEAARAYGEVLNLSPDDLIANYNLATYYKNKGEFDYAIELFSRASLYAETILQQRDIYSSLGDCYAGKGMWQEALASYEEALKRSPDDLALIEKVTRARRALNL